MGKTSKTKTIYVVGTSEDVVEDVKSANWTASTEGAARKMSRRIAKEYKEYGKWSICRVTIEELPAEEIPTPAPPKERDR